MSTQDIPAIIDESNFEATLMRYRGGIDAIDKQMAALLAERMSIVEKVGELKAAHGVSGSYIRPGREAIMVRELLDNYGDSHFPKAALASIWRIIIGSSTAKESPLNTLTLTGDANGQAHAAQYFGRCVPNKVLDIDALLATLAADRHAVAVLPYDKSAPYWAQLPANVHVFACIPFMGASPSHLACGYVTPEETGDDVTVCYGENGLMAQDGFTMNANGFVGAYAREYTL